MADLAEPSVASNGQTNGLTNGKVENKHSDKINEQNNTHSDAPNGLDNGDSQNVPDARPTENGGAVEPQTAAQDEAESSPTQAEDSNRAGVNGANSSSEPPSKSPQKFRSFGKPLRALTGKTGPPGGYDNTPLPDAPPGFTLRFIFQYAVNLPPADFNTASSDPFLTATLKANNPKRHKEDPDLVFRTRTVRRTTNPEWNAEWVVCNVPADGFSLKCRMYDEDYPDGNDRLGNVTLKVPRVYEGWQGLAPPGREFSAKKRMISKRAFIMKGVSGILTHNFHMTPRLCISVEVLGQSDPPYAQMYTEGPTYFFKHFSPMIGRLAGTKVNADAQDDTLAASGHEGHVDKSTQKYDFQANEMQLCGPVPTRLYHRYVEFKPFVSSMFMSKGLRGKILNAALHKQHARIYNFDKSTEYGTFEPCTPEASLQFLRLAHFDEGGRLFTYVLTLDGLLRFTETGHEFGIDLLSKHTMHSDIQTYIACSGEFFIRRLKHPDANDDPDPNEKTHPDQPISGGPPKSPPPPNPRYYQLVIDNDSGTYRPDKRILPDLKAFLERNFPGMGIVTMDCGNEHLQKMKQKQLSIKKKEGRMMNVVMNASQSSLSSAESDLDDRQDGWQQGQKSKREAAFAAIEDPRLAKEAIQQYIPGMNKTAGESSKQQPVAAN